MRYKIYAAQIQHLRRVTEAMRLLDLDELQRQARDYGTPADQALIAAVLLALEVLPADPHA